MKVVVIGGGVAGLTCGWALRNGPAGDPTPRQDITVTVLESSDRVGGKLRTDVLAGEDFDTGAEAFLARRPEAERLARRLGLADDLADPAQLGVHLWRHGRLVRYPSGTVFGVPTDGEALAAAQVVSQDAVARVVAEEFAPREPQIEDASVASVLGARLGREVVDVLVEPLLGGVYAGSADRLSIRSAAPVLWKAASTAGSLVSNLRGHLEATSGSTEPVFRTLRSGMGSLTDALARELDVRTSVAAVGLEQDGEGWVVHTTEGPLPADRVVIAVAAQPSAELLSGSAPVSARALRSVPYASAVVVATAWPRDAVELPQGSGMLVPRSEDKLVKATTWSSSKWGHVGARDTVAIRFSVGRVDDRRGMALDDRILTELVLAEGREMLGLTGEPADVVVQRWPDGLPQYDVGHLERVAAVRQGLPAGVHVTGALYDGVGIAPTIGHAESVAAAIREAR